MKKISVFLLLSFIFLITWSSDNGPSWAVKESYSDGKSGIDHPIVGKWEYVKTILSDGSEVIDMIGTEHFYSDGTGLYVDVFINPQPVNELPLSPEEIKSNFVAGYGGISTYEIEEGKERDKLIFLNVLNTDKQYIDNETHSIEFYMNEDTLIYFRSGGRQSIFKRVLLSTESNALLINEDIMLFPNPSNDRINLTGISHPADIKVFNINGNLIKSWRQASNTFDVSELPVGVYIVHLKSKNETVVRKLVKE